MRASRARDSSSDSGHASFGLLEPLKPDAMSRLLRPDRIDEELSEIISRGIVSQKWPQIPLPVAEEAGPHSAFGSDPETVASATERSGDRCNDADTTRCSIGKAVTARSAVAVGQGNFLKPMARGDGCKNVLLGDDTVTCPCASRIQRHVFDETHVDI